MRTLDKFISYAFFPAMIVGIIFMGHSCYQFLDQAEKDRLEREKLFEEKCAPLEVIDYKDFYRRGYYSVTCANENGESKSIYIKVPQQ